MQRKMELLEQKHALEKERTRIAQDMHDDLGARLTEILLLSDLAKQSKNDPDKIEAQIDRVSQAGRDIARNLDALVWAINPSNDSVEKLAAYLCKYAERFLSATTIRLRLDAPVELPDCLLSSEVRHNIFLVVKEALNNVVKHSAASEVGIRFETGAVLRITIEDNGKGFLINNAADEGNGLQNMEKRLRQMDAQFGLHSEPGRGTRIRLEIPMKPDPSLD
jgi:signal transduction histidine kinase